MVHEAEFEANPTVMNREMLQKVQAELIKCLALEEKYWQQKAGMTWFKEGDRNTKFFHAQVRGRRKRLQLNRIQNSGGTWIEEEQEIAEEAIKFYEEQFTEAATPSSFDIVEHVPNLINIEQNAELIKQLTKEEVKVAVLGLNGDSAGGQMVISRVVHERLVKFLPSLISEEQAGFVKGRNIVENILLTQEIVTDIRLRTKAGPNVILKLDMTKAYDRLSWLFLTKVLRKMGFTERLIGIVFGLVSNNWYSILINGQVHGFFKSSRGVKQGDPLSPTLFILAAEALPRGLNELHTNLYFCGIGMPKWSPKINHLVYAYDMIIFSSSDETSLMLVMQVLKAYEAASWQLVNKTKSAVYLHHLTNMEVVSKVERITGIQRNEFPIIYLGCPIFYARRKLEYYQPLITKVMDKMQSWQGKLLSVGAGQFSYPMLHKLFAQFFWSSSVGGTSRHWASWNTLCLPVEEGGIGFRSLYDVAKALFSKLWWNFRTKSSLWSSFVTLDGEWDVDRLFELLPEDLAVHILEKIKPPSSQQVLDMPCWMLETRGYFSVKSAWDYTRIRDEPRIAYRMIWVKGLPFKIAFFMWKVWKAKLPLDDFLKKVGYCMPSKCWCCVQPDEESFRHLFFRSESAKTTWKYFLSRAVIAVEGLTLHKAITKCWTANVCLRLKPVMQALPSCVVWKLWKRRNSMKYGDNVTTSRVIYQVSSNLQALVKVRKPGMDIVPHKWKDLLAVMENFTPKLK
uniref:Reverse transcriptase domain-containing protein n=1 Tax=Nicotiana tabacum TaxID=4097 RepID=A0A1S4DHZ1_TOBAC